MSLLHLARSSSVSERDTWQAMSEEDIEIIRATIDAVNRGDWDTVLKNLAPDFEFDLSHGAGPVHHGVYERDQMRGLWDDLEGNWESVRLEPHEFIEAGEHVVVPMTFHGSGRDGIEVQARPTWTFTIRDEAVERICMYQERKDALEAAGISE